MFEPSFGLVRTSGLHLLSAPGPINLAVEALDDFAEFGGHGFVEDCGQGGAEGTAADTAVAQGHPLAGFGHPEAVCPGNSFDEAAHREAAEVKCGTAGLPKWRKIMGSVAETRTRKWKGPPPEPQLLP